jgi:hypothetical protein
MVDGLFRWGGERSGDSPRFLDACAGTTGAYTRRSHFLSDLLVTSLVRNRHVPTVTGFSIRQPLSLSKEFSNRK